MLVEKFFETDELEQKVREFKKKWYKLGGLTEGLSNFKNGLDRGFIPEFNDISDILETIISEYPPIHVSLKKSIPEERERLDTDSERIIQSLSTYQDQVNKNQELIKKFQKDYKKITSYERELKDISREMNEIKPKIDKLCSKYEEKFGQYKFIKENITEKKQEKLEKLEKDFIEKFDSITEKYYVYTNGKEINARGLYTVMQDDPDIIDSITLEDQETPKNFLGFKIKKDTGEKESKLEVLKYVVNEAIDEFKPIIFDKKKDLKKLKAEFADLDGLEQTCNTNKKRENELKVYQNELTDKIDSIKKQNPVDFSDYNCILSTREELLKTFKETDSFFKNMFSFIDLSLSEVELETDIEKRSLRDELKNLKKNLTDLSKEKEKLEKEIKSSKKENETLKNEKDKLVEELKNDKSEIFTLNERIKQNEGDLEDLKEEKDSIFKENKEKKSQIEKLEENISRLNIEIDGLKGEKEKLIKSSGEKDLEIDSLKGQFSDLKDPIEKMGKDFQEFGESFQKKIAEFEGKINSPAEKK